jgi:HK97 family phage prohead protease
MSTIVRTVLSTITKQINVKGRRITFVGTKESPDRTGDIIRVNGWEFENFQKNPVFLWNHDSSIPPIGKVTKIQRLDKEVLFDVEFAPASVNEFADTVFKLFAEGFLSAVSVGFIPKDMEVIMSDDGLFVGVDILRQELLELSAVAIPAHQDALAASALGKKYDKWLDQYENSLREHSDKEIAKALSLEDFVKTLDPTTTEEDETMKEELKALQETVAQLQKDLAATITLRESVDLSVKTMETLNKTVVALLENKGSIGVPEVKTVPGVGSMPQTPMDLSKLMDHLGTALKKINESGKFKVQGDK